MIATTYMYFAGKSYTYSDKLITDNVHRRRTEDMIKDERLTTLSTEWALSSW